MQYTFYTTLLGVVFAYVCMTDPNVLDWIAVKINHFLVGVQLQYIKLKWRFKKF